MLFCPIKIAELNSEGPVLAPRWEIFAPLLSLAEAIQEITFTLCSIANPDFEPMWYFSVTGKYKP